MIKNNLKLVSSKKSKPKLICCGDTVIVHHCPSESHNHGNDCICYLLGYEVTIERQRMFLDKSIIYKMRLYIKDPLINMPRSAFWTLDEYAILQEGFKNNTEIEEKLEKLDIEAKRLEKINNHLIKSD